MMTNHPFVNNTKTIVYVGDVAPINSAASEAVLHRHLLALERSGYEICVITQDTIRSRQQLPSRWRKILLPSRKSYYPPYRPISIIREIRWIINDAFVMNTLRSMNIIGFISIMCGEYLASYAEWLARKYHKNLFYFYHDRGELLSHANNRRGAARMRRENIRLVRSQSTRRVWTVSPELIYSEEIEKFTILPPLPGRTGFARHRDPPNVTAAPVLGYIGTIYKESMDDFRIFLNQLRSKKGRFIAFSHYMDTAKQLHSEFPDVVEFRGFASDISDVIHAIRDEASAFLVISPNDVSLMPWSISCFPSKLTQLVQTGLPGIIFAPEHTSLGRWCVQREWHMYYGILSRSTVTKSLNDVQDPIKWNIASRDSVIVSEGEFNPENIEARVLNDIEMIDSESSGHA